MAVIKQHKFVAALPATIEANAIYFVRAGGGFDLYVTNSSGQVVAYPANKPSTNIGVSGRTSGEMEITSSTGNSALLPPATATLAGLMTAAQFNKLESLSTHGAAMQIFELPYLASGVFIAPVTGWYTFHVGGAGGPGNNTSAPLSRRPGASGAYAFKKVYIQEGQSVDIVVASGLGAGKTTVTGPGILVECASGDGGNNANTVPKGGVATGGDVNVNGIDGLLSVANGAPFPLFGRNVNYTNFSPFFSSPFPPGVNTNLPGFLSGAPFRSFLDVLGVGSSSASVSPPGVGGTSQASAGGIFAGGNTNTAGGTGDRPGGSGGLGAGGGGSYFANYSTTAPGGSGFVVVKWGV